MALLPHTLFQPPIPPILLRVHPASPLLWVPRLVLFLLTTAISLPVLLILIPVSVVLHSANIKSARRLAPLPIHPDNLPPQLTIARASIRGIVAYYASAAIWAITSVGLPPEQLRWLDRGLARVMCLIINLLHFDFGAPNRLGVEVDRVAPYTGPTLGVLQDGIAVAIEGYWLRKATSAQNVEAGHYGPGNRASQKKVILWLAGGGYITGYPLVHPFLFSLIRLLSSSEVQTGGECVVFAPSVRRALSRDRSFPSPLLDALAGYEKLRKEGWAAEDIIVMGDSAGGGLSWSLSAYLAILQTSRPECQLGVPGGLVLISPWLSLPPCSHSPYPDLVDTPHLTTAARCYLARYPIDDVDPFMPIKSALKAIFNSDRCVSESKDIKSRQVEADLENWLRQSVFERLSSHHPLISPSSDPDSPFVVEVLGQLASCGTRLLLYAGTAEWFYPDTLRLYRRAEKVGMDVQMREQRGGYHVEPCVLPAELWEPSRRLVDAIRVWLESPRPVESGIMSS